MKAQSVNPSDFVPYDIRRNPGMLRQCSHCGKLFALRKLESWTDDAGNGFVRYQCRKCNCTEDYRVHSAPEEDRGSDRRLYGRN